MLKTAATIGVCEPHDAAEPPIHGPFLPSPDWARLGSFGSTMMFCEPNKRGVLVPDFDLPAKNAASPFADMRAHHVAIRTTSLEEGKDFYVGKLDFRVVAEWRYEDEKLAYLVPPGDDNLFVEILGGGNTAPVEARPYTDLGDSLKYAGLHHFCLMSPVSMARSRHFASAALRSWPNRSSCRQSAASLPSSLIPLAT